MVETAGEVRASQTLPAVGPENEIDPAGASLRGVDSKSRSGYGVEIGTLVRVRTESAPVETATCAVAGHL